MKRTLLIVISAAFIIVGLISPLVYKTVGYLFSVIYYKSQNLWFVSLVHGTTNYPIVPLLTRNPLYGLAFMFITIAIAWVINKEHRFSQYTAHT